MPKLLLVVGVMVCLLLAGRAWAGDYQRLEPITSARLWQEFQDDREHAEACYLKQIVTVSGIVIDRNISKYLTTYVVLSDTQDGIAHVWCVLPRSDTFDLNRFDLGQRVTMAGTGYSYAEEEKVVILKGCIELTPGIEP